MVDRQRHRVAQVFPRSVADGRLKFFALVVVLGLLAIVGRLFMLQILSGKSYATLADAQHGGDELLTPNRGHIFIRDSKSASGQFSVAVNRTLYTVFSTPPDIVDAHLVAQRIAPFLGVEEKVLQEKLAQKTDPYVPLKNAVPEDAALAIKKLALKGIGMTREERRFYPESALLSHVLGFVASGERGGPLGRYGIEGYWNKELVGTPGYLSLNRDGISGFFGDGEASFRAAERGAELVLTIERPIQYFACEKLRAALLQHEATGGSLIIAEPKTGAILAMCSVPDFDPNTFSQTEDISIFNNPAIFTPYESGSVFKIVTMAAGIDSKKIAPSTTYEDKGFVQLGPVTIRNSDLQAHGIQTMTQVLEKSLNTGTVFAVRTMGADIFRSYVEKFGFGRTLGIELDTESTGNISALSKKGDIWSATGSFGQGITVTPLQLVAAYGAIANGGALMKPYVIDTVRYADGREAKTEPVVLRQVVAARTAQLVAGMLVDVVESGHGKRAGVPGYYVAGKTGTAQIPKKEGGGYEVGPTIGTFVGFAPVNNPAFVMMVKIDRPKDVKFAESTVAPLFGEIAKYLLQYFEIPAERK